MRHQLETDGAGVAHFSTGGRCAPRHYHPDQLPGHKRRQRSQFTSFASMPVQRGTGFTPQRSGYASIYMGPGARLRGSRQKKTVRQRRAASAPRSHSLGGALCFEPDNAGRRTAISLMPDSDRAQDGCAELHDRRASRSRSRPGHICARPVTERVPIVFALRGELARRL